MTHDVSPDRFIGALVVRADRSRRSREATRAVALWAPQAALVLLLLSGLGRWWRWEPGVIPVLLAAVMAVTAVWWAASRRATPVSDAAVSRLDADAALHGELRSAHWFVRQTRRDSWTSFHLDHAAECARAINWDDLYPPVSATRAWSATAILISAAMVIAFVGAPRTRSVPVRLLPQVTSTSTGTSMPSVLPEVVLPEDIRAALLTLLAAIKQGQGAPTDAVATLSKPGALSLLNTADLDQLRDALRQLPRTPPVSAPPAPASPATSDAPEANPDDRDADADWRLQNLIAQTTSESVQRAAGDQTSGQPGSASQSAGPSAASAVNGGSGSLQLAREPGGQASGMMLGAGGGFDGRSGSGLGETAADRAAVSQQQAIADVLKREVVDANSDMVGSNVKDEERRRETEQSHSTLGFTHVALAPAAGPTRVEAAPAVPEDRRLLVQRYFTRDQSTQ